MRPRRQWWWSHPVRCPRGWRQPCAGSCPLPTLPSAQRLRWAPGSMAQHETAQHSTAEHNTAQRRWLVKSWCSTPLQLHWKTPPSVSGVELCQAAPAPSHGTPSAQRRPATAPVDPQMHTSTTNISTFLSAMQLQTSQSTTQHEKAAADEAEPAL